MSDINTLRTALFETLNGLKDKTIDIDRAKAINETAQTLINTAKVEVDFMKCSGSVITSGFLPQLSAPSRPANPTEELTGSGTKTIENVAGGTIITHRTR